MDQSISDPLAAQAGEFELGEILGQRRAFSAVAGRCSAADAACLRRMRDQKLYLRRSPNWEEFCPKHLGLSKTQANRIIRVLDEFGPDYFELAQLIRVTPQEFRALAPAVKDKTIRWNGEAIALIPENSEKVAAAVAQLRRAVAPEVAAQTPAQDRLPAIERRFDQLVEDFVELYNAEQGAERLILASVLRKTVVALEQLLHEALGGQ